MTETAYLSPNGQALTAGNGTVTRILVATLKGIAVLERETRGRHWTVTDRLLEDRHIGAIVKEPVSGKLFAGCHHAGGVYVSDDGEGAGWWQINKGLDREHVYTLAVRNAGGRTTLFAGTSPAGLYRSDDLGESWTEIASIYDVADTDKWTFPPPPHIPHVKTVTFHPTEPETLFVLVEQGAFLKSTDDGRTWTDLTAYSKPEDVAYRDMHRMLIDPADPDRFFLATGEGLYRSTDGGKSFDHLMKRFDRMGYPDFLFFDPADAQTLYMGGSYLNPAQWYKEGIAESTVMRSTDGGDSWEEVSAGLPDPVVGAFEAMSLHRWDGGMMLMAGTATGEVYASDDYCRSWVCLDDDVEPVSKDDHHLPFMSKEERRAAMAARGL
jgi:photosystem II stability/assembly factor-like uncharacterized protein